MQLEDRARIWWAISLPYRLSVNYEVRVVDIDADHHRRPRRRSRPRPGGGGAQMTARTRSSGPSTCSWRSPVWLRLVDTFTGTRAGGPVEVRLERRSRDHLGSRSSSATSYAPRGPGVRWISAGSRPGWPGRPSTFGSPSAVPRSIVRRPLPGRRDHPDDRDLERDQSPPAPACARWCVASPRRTTRSARASRCSPDAWWTLRPCPSPRGPGHGSPRRCSATSLIEEVRTGAGGWFRMPLRWSSGATRSRRPGRARPAPPPSPCRRPRVGRHVIPIS